MRKIAEALWTERLSRSPVFTTAEAAGSAGVTSSNASRALAKMSDAGMITRIRRGLWAITAHPDFSPFAVFPRLLSSDEQGYVSLLSALNLHGMIEQFPHRVQVVSTVRRADLRTPVAVFEFHQIAPPLFGGFKSSGTLGQFDLATPEKALFDTLYFSAQKGRRFKHLPELTIPPEFSAREVESWTNRVQNALLRRAVRARWQALPYARNGRVS